MSGRLRQERQRLDSGGAAEIRSRSPACLMRRVSDRSGTQVLPRAAAQFARLHFAGEVRGTARRRCDQSYVPSLRDGGRVTSAAEGINPAPMVLDQRSGARKPPKLGTTRERSKPHLAVRKQGRTRQQRLNLGKLSIAESVSIPESAPMAASGRANSHVPAIPSNRCFPSSARPSATSATPARSGRHRPHLRRR